MLLVFRKFISRQFTRLPLAAAGTAGTDTFGAASKKVLPALRNCTKLIRRAGGNIRK